MGASLSGAPFYLGVEERYKKRAASAPTETTLTKWVTTIKSLMIDHPAIL